MQYEPHNYIQECIPVGCVPSAAVAILVGGGVLWLENISVKRGWPCSAVAQSVRQVLTLCCLQTILDAILPHYLEFIKQETLRRDCAGAAREEIGVLCNIAVTMRALVSSCEPLARYVLLAPKGSFTTS